MEFYQFLLPFSAALDHPGPPVCYLLDIKADTEVSGRKRRNTRGSCTGEYNWVSCPEWRHILYAKVTLLILTWQCFDSLVSMGKVWGLNFYKKNFTRKFCRISCLFVIFSYQWQMLRTWWLLTTQRAHYSHWFTVPRYVNISRVRSVGPEALVMHHQETEQWKYFRSLIAPIAFHSGKVRGEFLVTC